MHAIDDVDLMKREGRETPRRVARLADGLEIAYADAGAGPSVVLIHGTLTALDDMILALSDGLVDRYRIIAFDRPGFGRSGRRRGLDAGLERQAARLWEALDVLGVETPLLVGHSIGASVALTMALDRPDRTTGVVAVAPIVWPEPRLEHVLFGPRAVFPGGSALASSANLTSDRALLPLLWRAMFLPQAMPEAVVKTFPFAIAGDEAASVRAGEDSLVACVELASLARRAAACAVPVRIFGGDQDLVVRNGVHGRCLAALMPNAVFVDLPGLGHMAHHFASDRIVQAVDELAGRSARPPLD